MPHFYYVAIDKGSGNKQRGILKADDVRDAFDRLSGLNLVPERLTRLPDFLVGLLRTKPHMNTAEIVEFLKSVGYGLNAGVPLLELLVSLQNDISSKKAKAALQELAMMISQGNSFSQSLRELGFFSPLVLSFAEVGEMTGNLGDNLIKAANRLEFLESLKGQVKKAMIYPLFIAFTIMLSVGIWLFVVIPKVSEFLKALDVKLPAFTQYLIRLSQNRMELVYQVGSVIGVIISIIIANKMIKKFFGKEHIVLYIKDRFFLFFPVVGRIIYNYNHFLISSFAGGLIGAGVNIDRIFHILSNVVNNAVYYRAIRKADVLIREGESISNAFRDSGVFSSMFNRYVNVGERTGTLDTQLEFMADIYREKVDSTLSLLPKLLEPLLILFVGGIMLAMIVAIFMPIYGSISKIIGQIQ